MHLNEILDHIDSLCKKADDIKELYEKEALSQDEIKYKESRFQWEQRVKEHVSKVELCKTIQDEEKELRLKKLEENVRIENQRVNKS